MNNAQSQNTNAHNAHAHNRTTGEGNLKGWPSLLRAALVVRTLALVATFIPMKPARAELNEPSTNETPTSHDDVALSAVTANSTRHAHHEYDKDFVFCFKEGHGALGNVAGDFLHFVGAGILFRYKGISTSHRWGPAHQKSGRE